MALEDELTVIGIDIDLKVLMLLILMGVMVIFHLMILIRQLFEWIKYRKKRRRVNGNIKIYGGEVKKNEEGK